MARVAASLKVEVQAEPRTLASQLNLNRKPPVQLETLSQGNRVRKEEDVEVSLWPFQEHSASIQYSCPVYP